MIALLMVSLATAPVNVGVAEREWHVSSYVPSVRRGRIAFNVHNFGEDPHDLQVRGPHGFHSRPAAPIAPGATAILTVALHRPGTYRLVCTLPGHAARGMRTTLRVR